MGKDIKAASETRAGGGEGRGSGDLGLLLLDVLEDGHGNPGDDALVLGGPHHTVRLSRPRLSVGEDAYIITLRGEAQGGMVEMAAKERVGCREQQQARKLCRAAGWWKGTEKALLRANLPMSSNTVSCDA